MTPAARLAAAIEVFSTIESERRPAADALKTWGAGHRFAGSGDRAAIAGIVYDGLRRRASSAFLMGADTPRAILLGMLRRERGLATDAIARLADGGQYAPAELTADERKHLDSVGVGSEPIGGRQHRPALGYLGIFRHALAVVVLRLVVDGRHLLLVASR